jgi:uncharacterized membrane protein YagU involved in acid resistance
MKTAMQELILYKLISFILGVIIASIIIYIIAFVYLYIAKCVEKIKIWQNKNTL